MDWKNKQERLNKYGFLESEIKELCPHTRWQNNDEVYGTCLQCGKKIKISWFEEETDLFD